MIIKVFFSAQSRYWLVQQIDQDNTETFVRVLKPEDADIWIYAYEDISEFHSVDDKAKTVVMLPHRALATLDLQVEQKGFGLVKRAPASPTLSGSTWFKATFEKPLRSLYEKLNPAESI